VSPLPAAHLQKPWHEWVESITENENIELGPIASKINQKKRDSVDYNETRRRSSVHLDVPPNIFRKIPSNLDCEIGAAHGKSQVVKVPSRLSQDSPWVHYYKWQASRTSNDQDADRANIFDGGRNLDPGDPPSRTPSNLSVTKLDSVNQGRGSSPESSTAPRKPKRQKMSKPNESDGLAGVTNQSVVGGQTTDKKGVSNHTPGPTNQKETELKTSADPYRDDAKSGSVYGEEQDSRIKAYTGAEKPDTSGKHLDENQASGLVYGEGKSHNELGRSLSKVKKKKRRSPDIGVNVTHIDPHQLQDFDGSTQPYRKNSASRVRTFDLNQLIDSDAAYVKAQDLKEKTRAGAEGLDIADRKVIPSSGSAYQQGSRTMAGLDENTANTFDNDTDSVPAFERGQISLRLTHSSADRVDTDEHGQHVTPSTALAYQQASRISADPDANKVNIFDNGADSGLAYRKGHTSSIPAHSGADMLDTDINNGSGPVCEEGTSNSELGGFPGKEKEKKKKKKRRAPDVGVNATHIDPQQDFDGSTHHCGKDSTGRAGTFDQNSESDAAYGKLLASTTPTPSGLDRLDNADQGQYTISSSGPAYGSPGTPINLDANRVDTSEKDPARNNDSGPVYEAGNDNKGPGSTTGRRKMWKRRMTVGEVFATHTDPQKSLVPDSSTQPYRMSSTRRAEEDTDSDSAYGKLLASTTSAPSGLDGLDNADHGQYTIRGPASPSPTTPIDPEGPVVNDGTDSVNRERKGHSKLGRSPGKGKKRRRVSIEVKAMRTNSQQSPISDGCTPPYSKAFTGRADESDEVIDSNFARKNISASKTPTHAGADTFTDELGAVLDERFAELCGKR